MKKNINSECIIGNAILQLNGLKKTDIYLYENRLNRLLSNTDYTLDIVTPGDIFDFCEKYRNYINEDTVSNQIYINNEFESKMKELFFYTIPSDIRSIFDINNNYIFIINNGYKILEYLVIFPNGVKNEINVITRNKFDKFIDLRELSGTDIFYNVEFKLISESSDYEIAVMMMGLENILSINMNNISSLLDVPDDLLNHEKLLNYYRDLAFRYSLAKKNSNILKNSSVNINYQKKLTI